MDARKVPAPTTIGFRILVAEAVDEHDDVPEIVERQETELLLGIIHSLFLLLFDNHYIPEATQSNFLNRTQVGKAVPRSKEKLLMMMESQSRSREEFFATTEEGGKKIMSILGNHFLKNT